ncbi:MAG: HEAT repeat domain-containing protein [Candidatus Shapirobacteria bacterium]|jgi:hypothetical protein
MPKSFDDLLDKDQIKERLVTVVDAELADKISEKFWRLDSFANLISIPFFLNFLVDFLKETRLKGTFSKYDFYGYLLRKVSGGGEFLDKLTQLALVVELHQVNEFDPTGFSGILNGLGINSEDLERTGLIEKDKRDEKDVIGFCHHTISEFLVANFLFGQDDFIDKLEKFALVKDDKNVLAIAFSWYGVIRFLLDSDKSIEVRNWLLKLVEGNKELVDDGFCNAITSVESKDLSQKEKKYIFDLVYDTYQGKKVWLPIWTRVGLPNFCGKDSYEKLKVDVQNGSGTESDVLVRKGTAVDIVARLMESNSPLIAGSEKEWWKEKLVDLANDGNDNGVVQRHALTALATYHDVGLIPRLGRCLSHKDNLVREAFIQFCSETNPNDETTINLLVKGIVEKGTDIYSRHGFYQITSKEGVKVFLKHLVNSSHFLKKFLDKESIFNSKDKNSDEVIVKRIEEFTDTEIIGQLKQIIKNSFEQGEIYDQGRSYFLKRLALVTGINYPEYIFELIERIRESDGDKWGLAYDYSDLFSWLITTENVTEFYKRLSGINERCKRLAEKVIYGTRYGDEAVYKTAVKNRLVTKIEDLEDHVQNRDRDGEILKEFRQFLGTDSDKKYFPSVFEYFVQNQKLITSKWTKQEKERLKKLVINEGLEKIDPKNIVVKIQKSEGGRANQYNISRVASYFGDVVRTAIVLGLNLNKYRQKIINFIPFAYSDDRQAISEVVDQIEDKDLAWVNQAYADKTGDIRYFLPDSYIYLVRDYREKGCELGSAKEILLSFAIDGGLSNQDRRYAVETLGEMVDQSDLEIKDELEKDLGSEEVNKVAMDVLIAVFKDDRAIKERIGQIKAWSTEAEKYAVPESGVCHSVSSVEEEMDGMSLAQPLMKMGDDRYKNEFIGLLNYSVEILKDDEKKEVLWTYVNYLWRTVIGYFNGLENKNFEIIGELEDWLVKNRDVDKVNWFEGRLVTLKQSYIEESSKKTTSKALRIITEIYGHIHD